MIAPRWCSPANHEALSRYARSHGFVPFQGKASNPARGIIAFLLDSNVVPTSVERRGCQKSLMIVSMHYF